MISLREPRIFHGYEFYTGVVQFDLEIMPGCRGILVSTHTYVHERFRNMGINTFLQKVKNRIAKENDFSLLLATTRRDNDPEVHILETSGWKKIHEFGNKKTYNDVIFWVKEVK